MISQSMFGFAAAALVLTACASTLRAEGAAPPAPASDLLGTWTLTAADDLHPDGTRTHAYGQSPRGLLIFTADGHYSVQIYRSDRARFASGDKRTGTPDEYRGAALGMSVHFGRWTADAAGGSITFQIEGASFPNWEGAVQKRPFTLNGDELSWRVPAAPDGTIPLSVWRRVR